MRIKGLVAVLLLTTMLTGCASIVGQSIFPLVVNSNPNGANMTVTDDRGLQMYMGTTPATIPLAAGDAYFHAKSYQIKFSKPGYADQVVVVKSEISGWYFGNLLFGGLIGFLVIDPITGKMWKLPQQSFTSLSPLGAVVSENSPVNDAPAVVSQPNSADTKGNGGVVAQPKASLKKGASVLQIATLDQIPEELRKQMVRIN